MKKAILIIFAPAASGEVGCVLVTLFILALPVFVVLGIIGTILQEIGLGVKHIITPPLSVITLTEVTSDIRWVDNDTITFSGVIEPVADSIRELRTSSGRTLLWNTVTRQYEQRIGHFEIDIHPGSVPNEVSWSHLRYYEVWRDSQWWRNHYQIVARHGSPLSPDGTTLAQSRNTRRQDYRRQDIYEVLVSNPNRSNERFVTYAQCEVFAWSPDGQHLACAGWETYRGQNGYFLKIILNAGDR